MCHITTECLLFFFPDSLSLTGLKYVIFDWNWRDQKLRRLVDIPEVQRNNLFKTVALHTQLTSCIPGESGYLMCHSLEMHGISYTNAPQYFSSAFQD